LEKCFYYFKLDKNLNFKRLKSKSAIDSLINSNKFEQMKTKNQEKIKKYDIKEAIGQG